MYGGDQTIYQDAQTLVSRSRVVLNGAIYPVHTISSVRWCLVSNPWNLVYGGTGIILTLVTCGLWLPIGILYALIAKKTYALVLGSGGGERQALIGPENQIAPIVYAINQALSAR